MIDFIRSRPIVSAVLAFVVLVVLLGSFPIVPETKQAVIVRFGKPVRILNQYEPGQPIGTAGAGITWRIPFVDQIVWIDKRVLAVDMERQQVLSTDQRRLEVDAFARYRIVDPLLMYIRVGTEENLQRAAAPILGRRCATSLASSSSPHCLSPERAGRHGECPQVAGPQRGQYRRARSSTSASSETDLPDGAPLQSAFERMRTARLQEARSIRAQGAKQAQIIRAQADADAAKTYAASFGKDPQFYDFYRAMQSYQTTFIGDPARKSRRRPNIILSPQNDYLKEFTGRSK